MKLGGGWLKMTGKEANERAEGRPWPSWARWDGATGGQNWMVSESVLEGGFDSAAENANYGFPDTIEVLEFFGVSWKEFAKERLKRFAGPVEVQIKSLEAEMLERYPEGSVLSALKGRWRDLDGSPRIRSELAGLMGPGYRATGVQPRARIDVPMDDPTGDDIAGDAP